MDTLGRLIAVSNPTEIDSNWTPAGDDMVNGSQGGYRLTQQTYDWNNRPPVTTNQDGMTHSISYAGCGCAGGNVATMTDEGTIYSGAPGNRQERISCGAQQEFP